MEIRFRVCATPRRVQHFSDHAAHTLSSALPAQVERGQILHQSHSVLLQRQWERLNGPTPPSGLQTLDIGFAFHDPGGRLTTEELESIANSVVADLMPPGESNRERVPWILTLNAGVDQTSRAAITEQYQPLGTA